VIRNFFIRQPVLWLNSSRAERELTEMDRDCQDKEKAMKHSVSNASVFSPVHPVHPCLIIE
jgi:hypothetical protein